MAFAAVETGRRRRRQRQHAPTLREVAERAGVSTASASRALARPALVSADVHSKVLDAASALAYVPNASARALAARYLHGLGHRRLCLVGEPAMGRSVQLLSALSDLAEVRIDSCDFRNVHPKEFGHQVVERWMALGADAPSALVCSSDLVGAS